MSDVPDLLVAGGGPAGLATALFAARAGLDVQVWEPREGVIDKACGEGLMPGAVAGLARLGVDPSGRDLLGIRYVADGRAATADFRAGPGRGVRRTALHDALRRAVDAAGIEVVQRSVRRVTQDDQAVVVDGVRVRHLVAADGLHSPVRRALGLDAPQRGQVRFGQRQHHGTAPWSSHVEVHWSRDAEAYVTPVADDVVGVAVLSRRKGPYLDRLAGFPELAERLQGAPAVSTIRGAGPLRQGARRRVAGRVLLVGDAAGYVDALTGEGVALGLAQAEAAVAALVAGAPGRYERDWIRLTRRYRWLTGALLAGTRPAPLRRAVVPVARTLPPVFRAAVDALARPVAQERGHGR
ncbi:MAG: NAD(P)/FAD-dependent oxidoreductase [Nocardioides sp.]|nr:NAD(P)/FAD-dependent oxidoreductase [Nocardioides sp.]